ncbi:hypothetical protein F4778DRAFT_800817 [Xylariomycetidae sp. FL2044]|nr:hypothetical protein F4778DRAFT_800817 [Xylariomycetidae sp. FL2044]
MDGEADQPPKAVSSTNPFHEHRPGVPSCEIIEPGYTASAAPAYTAVASAATSANPSSSPPPPSPPPAYFPSRRERLRYHINKILPKCGLPLALMVGIAITTSTTWALATWVQRLVDNARIPADPQRWMQEARAKDWDPCYQGCDDCDDPSYAWDACVRTALVGAVDCDARNTWNWADRYPEACLLGRGAQYRERALEDLRQSYRDRLAIILLTVLAGVLGGCAVYALWKRATAGNRARAEGVAQSWPGWRANRIRAKLRPHRVHGHSHGHGQRIKGFFAAAVLALCGTRKGAAAAAAHATWPCVVGPGSLYDAYFTNGNRTISVSVHGWLSECQHVTTCEPVCSPACSQFGCATVCDPVCTQHREVRRRPQEYVDAAAVRVRQCGFEDLVDADASLAQQAHLRVANPGIERHWWVKISVNAYNVTDPRDTDPMVRCLHDIGGA